MGLKKLVTAAVLLTLVASSAMAGAIGLEANTVDLGGTAPSWIPTSTANLNNASAIIKSDPAEKILSYVASGYNYGAWDGFGITSAMALANPLGNTRIGLVSGNDYLDNYGPGATFYTQVVQPGWQLLKYTYGGDADLNGAVDGDDYGRIDGAYGNISLGFPQVVNWINGDFDYNGFIDGDDYGIIDGAYGTQGTALSLSGPTAVPEPSTCVLLVLASILGLAFLRK